MGAKQCCGLNKHGDNPFDLRKVEIIVNAKPPEGNVPTLSIETIIPDYGVCHPSLMFPVSSLTVIEAKRVDFNPNNRSIIGICQENSEISTDELSMITRFREFLEDYNKEGVENLIS